MQKIKNMRVLKLQTNLMFYNTDRNYFVSQINILKKNYKKAVNFTVILKKKKKKLNKDSVYKLFRMREIGSFEKPIID